MLTKSRKKKHVDHALNLLYPFRLCECEASIVFMFGRSLVNFTVEN